jgi:hypothetical protein
MRRRIACAKSMLGELVNHREMRQACSNVMWSLRAATRLSLPRGPREDNRDSWEAESCKKRHVMCETQSKLGSLKFARIEQLYIKARRSSYRRRGEGTAEDRPAPDPPLVRYNMAVIKI